MPFITTVLLLASLSFAETKVPNVPLVNQDGTPFQFHDFEGRNTVLSFIFTRCPLPKMCPLTMTLSKNLYSEWKKQKKKGTKPLQIALVTLDPAYDNPEVLKEFGKKHKVDFKVFTFATGNANALAQFALNFKVVGYPQDGTIAHTMKTVLIGPDLVPIAEYPENLWDAKKILALLK